MCLITPPLSGNSSPTENSTPGPLSPMQPYQKSSLRMARLQRKARLQLNRHSYTDEEMRAILQEMWKSQDNCKLLRGNPEFVAKYVKAGLVSKEEEAVLLRDRVHFNLCTRLSSQEGIRCLYYKNSESDPSKLVWCFSWFAKKPVLPSLLSDLPILLFEETSEDEMELNLEDSPTLVQSGHTLEHVSEPFERPDVISFGTLGMILSFEDNISCKHVVATVGHLIGDHGTQLRLEQGTSENEVLLTTINGCRRFLGRPTFRQKWIQPRPMIDEICLLDIPATNSIILQCIIEKLDFRKISSISSTLESELDHPGVPRLRDVELLVEFLRHESINVFRMGDESQEVKGKLIRLKEVLKYCGQLPRSLLRGPSSSTSTSSSSSEEIEQDDTRVYLLIIKWISPEIPFAGPGDSGSLVYAKVDEHVIPLGLHVVGSKDDVSRAVLLHTWWTEFEAAFHADVFFL